MRKDWRVLKTTQEERAIVRALVDNYNLILRTEYSKMQPILFWYRDAITFGSNDDNYDETFDTITFAEFVNRIITLVATRYKTVKLNSDYTAEIHKESKIVKVGCQTFSFEKIEELYNAINQ